MVFDYAQKLIGSAKDKVSGAKNRISPWSGNSKDSDPDNFEEIRRKTSNINTYEERIDSDLEDIRSSYRSQTQKARKSLDELQDFDFSLDTLKVDNSDIVVNGRNGFAAELFEDSYDVIEIGSNNLADYVDELETEISARAEDIMAAEEAMERIGDLTLGEYLDSEHEVSLGDDYLESLIGSTKIQGIGSARQRQKQEELRSLENELIETVDRYTQEIYEDAVELAEDLGGTKRPGRGHFDTLRDLSNSRRDLVSGAGRTINRSSVLDDSREALETQTAVVDRYIDLLESYQQGIQHLYEKASNVVDQERLQPVYKRFDAITQGLEGLSDVVNEGEYSSLDQALEQTVKPGTTRNRRAV